MAQILQLEFEAFNLEISFLVIKPKYSGQDCIMNSTMIIFPGEFNGQIIFPEEESRNPKILDSESKNMGKKRER